jgi:hypothetical protein
VRRGVQLATGVRIIHPVAEHLRPEPHVPADGPGVRVEQELRRVVAQPPARVPRPGHPVAVGLAGTDVRHETVPDARVVLGELDPGLAAVVEQADVHRIRTRGDREVRATGQ